MDDSKLLTEDGNTEDQVNGVLNQHTSPYGEGLDLHKVNGVVKSSEETVQPDGNTESTAHLEEDEKDRSSKGEVEGGLIVYEAGKKLTDSKDSGKKNHDQAKHSKLHKGQGKSSNSSINETTSITKHAVATWVKKNKDGKQEKATSPVSNGSHLKQPFAHGTNKPSFNGRQGIEHNASVDLSRPTRSSSAPSSTLNSKHSGNFGSSSSATNTSQSEGTKEQMRDLKPLKQGSQKTEEYTHSSPVSPTEAGSKPRKVGTAPSYSFNFRCVERAEKRKEFFSKLEQKIHAKEVEKTNQQAKCKETQEAEIKLLRKSLNFKANPMPSFYQEPAPPKAELKKIPPTRAKSPKLGRQKSLARTDAEGNSSRSCRSARLSLDDRVAHNGPAKDSHTHMKKPQRKSLPKLPSEKSNLVHPSDDSPKQPLNEQNMGSDTTPAIEQIENEAMPAANEEQSKSADTEPVNEVASSEPLAVQ